MNAPTGPAWSPAEIAAAREWVSDCQWAEHPEQVAALPDPAIVRGVERHYDGGMAGLVRDAQLEPERQR